jgi:c(7)-type cytochrome triheme protein
MPVFTFRADRLGLCAPSGIALLCCLFGTAAGWAGQGPVDVRIPSDLERKWLPLSQDGIHDPEAPAVRDGLLQDPAVALTPLSPDYAGNQVRWVLSLMRGEIEPRENLMPGTKNRRRDRDVLLSLRGGMPIVRFPHDIHTEWLDCSNCHDKIFKEKLGATRLSMYAILQGEQCGVCHGAVAFPLTECSRCHSIPRGTRPQASAAEGEMP